jgi:hypothetical protein
MGEISADLITERELREATGIDHHTLRRVRGWLFLDPVRKFPGRGTGSVTYYPATAVALIKRYLEMRKNTRNIDECIWRLWIEEFPIDIRQWAIPRLAAFETVIATAESDINTTHKDMQKFLASAPTRTEARRPIQSRIGPNAVNSLFLWATYVARGFAPPKSLYDPASPAFDALKRAAGLIGNWEPPDAELLVESLSVGHLSEIVNDASQEELDQARRDWRLITELADEAEAIDWLAIRRSLNVLRTSSAQPIAPIDLFVSFLRDFSARAVPFAGLIHIRRSPDHSHRLSEILALAKWALTQFPRRPNAEQVQ